MRLLPVLFALVAVSAALAAAPVRAQDRAVPYALPDGPDVLQAKLSGPLPGSYDVVCDSLTDDACQVFPGTYQLQTFDREWNATRTMVEIAPGTATPGAGEPGTGRPAPPANLRFEFYSTTAGVLSWDRASTPALRYEVRRDGVTVVPATFAINFQEREARLLDRSHLYEVVAITPDNRRSEPARYFLRSFLENPDPLANPAPLPDGGGESLAAPTNLRFTFYSTFAGALSWDRPATPGLRYEVRRNGRTVVDSTDGIDYQERDARFVDTRYVYEVIAIAPDGRRSAASRLIIDDFEQTTETGPDVDPARPPLDEPADLRAEVYSSTAAELFWRRFESPGLRFEITREGEIVGTTDGNSFYDDGLAGGTTYLYEVTAVQSGRRSASSGVEVSTPGAGTSPSPSEGGGSSALEERESFELNRRPEAIDAIESVTEFFDGFRLFGVAEQPLPADRPYVEQRETSTPFSRDPFVPGTTESVLIDIDATGTGTYRDVSTYEDDDTRRLDSRIATRTFDGTAVTWAGTYLYTDSSSARRESYDFTTETRSSGDGEFLQRGEFRREGSSNTTADQRPIEVSYELTTAGPIEGLRECDPLAGTIVYDSGFNARTGPNDFTFVETETRIEKREGERYWTVRETTKDDELLRDEYRIVSIGLGPFCDFPEFTASGR